MQNTSFFWGEVTSTLDWCEENYAVSPYIAEFVNTTTNLTFFILPLLGLYNSWKERLQKRFFYSHLCIMFVGFGSWWFHMTLQYEMQLLDELPMIYGSCLLVWNVLETNREYVYGYKLPLALVSYAAFVTYSYIILNSPIFHQVSYGLLVVFLVYRSAHIVHMIPASDKKKWLQFLLRTGAGFYLFGFFLWNIDNQFCENLKGFRRLVGWPWGAVSELHGWWHVFTGLGTYYFVCFNEWIHQVLIGEGADFDLVFIAGFAPYVKRISKEPSKTQ